MWEILGSLTRALQQFVKGGDVAGRGPQAGSGRSTAVQAARDAVAGAVAQFEHRGFSTSHRGGKTVSPAEQAATATGDLERRSSAERDLTASQEELDRQTEDSTQQMRNFTKALTTIVSGAGGVVAGFRLVSRQDETVARQLVQFDASLARSIGTLDRERVLRQAEMARTTSEEASGFVESKNRQEQAFAPINQWVQRRLYDMGTFWNGFTTGLADVTTGSGAAKARLMFAKQYRDKGLSEEDADKAAQAEIDIQEGRTVRSHYDDQGVPHVDQYKTPANAGILNKALQGDAALNIPAFEKETETKAPLPPQDAGGQKAPPPSAQLPPIPPLDRTAASARKRPPLPPMDDAWGGGTKAGTRRSDDRGGSF